MNNEKISNGLNFLVVSLVILVLGLSGYIIYNKMLSNNNQVNQPIDNDNTDSNNQQNNNENIIQNLINSIKITNMEFNKPHESKLGGGPSYTLETNMTVDLKCTNNDVKGITVKGYCLDMDDNKYLFSGPRGVIAFYCNNDSSYSHDTNFVQAYQLFKTDGNNYIIPDENNNIKWENIEIKYCKFDEAHLILSDYSELNTKIDLNFEKEFK